LIDRIDLQIQVNQEKERWMDLPLGEASSEVRARVDQVWIRQHARQGVLNARLSDGQLDGCCPMDTGAKNLLDRLVDKYYLSARSIQRMRRVARTIADLDCCTSIEAQHLAEAFQYRFKSS
jgi:magnesium chelatase family protein